MVSGLWVPVLKPEGTRLQQMKANGKEEARHNTIVKEAMLSIPHLQQGRMKTKSKDLSFIHGPFEGRFNPKISLSPFIF